PAVEVGEVMSPVRQVAAHVGIRAPEISTYTLPSAVPFGLLALIALAIYAMFVFPGPTLATIEWADDIFAAVGVDNGGKVGVTVMLLARLLPLLVLLFLGTQFKTFSQFSARHPRSSGTWRAPANNWRRNEESRGYYLVETVNRIAKDRFDFPDEAN